MSSFRQSPFANMSPVVKYIIIINIILFIPVLLFDNDLHSPIASTFGVYYFNSPDFRVWQLLTHMFMHGGWMHIFFNMYALYIFGNTVEFTLGSKRFFQFYFICGFGAIALQMYVQAFELHSMIGSYTISNAQELYRTISPEMVQKIRSIYEVPMVGASGAIFGVLIAFAMLYPNVELMLLFPPIPIKAKYLIPIFVAFEIYSGFQENPGDSVAHFAHLGGALFGFFMIKLWGLSRRDNHYH